MIFIRDDPETILAHGMIRTVFLDRDGIINEIVQRGDTASSPRSMEEFQIRPDFEAFYPSLKQLASRIFVVSNQPDVSRKLLSENALAQIDDELQRRFDFDEIVYCKHDDAHGCECRKPKPGMINTLLGKHALHRNEALIIGDSYKDILAGQAAGIRTIYCLQSYNSTISCEPDYIVNKLTEALTLPIFKALS